MRVAPASAGTRRMMDAYVLPALQTMVGAESVVTDPGRLDAYGTDALKRGHPADVVVLPANTAEVAAVARFCHEHHLPLTPRGAGTGYTGGAVPVRGGVVLSLERLNRILEIDEANLLAVVEPFVVTGRLQEAVERVGLFYPPDPASLNESVIGGNVAECAGGPRAFKYGTTKRYVLGLEAVLPNGDVIRTGGKTVKNVVGYDLTQLLVGSEGTLAIITQVILRLIPKPETQTTFRVAFRTVEDAVAAVIEMGRLRVVPAALELIDDDSLAAVSASLKVPAIAPPGTGALLIVEVDGLAPAVAEEAGRVEEACRRAGAVEVIRARDGAERTELWRVRRELSPSLKVLAPMKFNHDVVVPKGRIPELVALVRRLRHDLDLRIPVFGHVGDGNIHVNIMADGTEDVQARVRQAEQRLFEGVVALEGAISGEHGIGFAKAQFLPLALSAETIALMKKLKAAFDPHGILNPGKIFA